MNVDLLPGRPDDGDTCGSNRLANSIFRAVIIAIVLAILISTATAQSGRSWMEGFVFTDSSSQGFAGATVELLGDPEYERVQSVRLSTTTSQEGKYSIRDIPYGEYIYRVTSEGYEKYEIKIYIAPDMLTQIHVRLKQKKQQ